MEYAFTPSRPLKKPLAQGSGLYKSPPHFVDHQCPVVPWVLIDIMLKCITNPGDDVEGWQSIKCDMPIYPIILYPLIGMTLQLWFWDTEEYFKNIGVGRVFLAKF